MISRAGHFDDPNWDGTVAPILVGKPERNLEPGVTGRCPKLVVGERGTPDCNLSLLNTTCVRLLIEGCF